MKKILSSLVCLWVAAASTAQAQLTYTTNNNQLTVTGFSGGGAVTIPAVFNTLPVVSIANGAFEDSFTLTSIAIGSNVTSIGSGAFEDCVMLASVTLPGGLTNLGSSAFQFCTNLPGIVLPDSLTNLGASTFQECYSLTNVILGSNLATIGSSAFYECTSLAGIIIPNSVTNIGGQAFYECYDLAGASLGSGITGMGSQVFYDCYSLKNVTLASGLTAIGQDAFENCTSLSSIAIPGTATNLGSDIFDYCYNLNSVSLGSGLTSLPNSLFYYCYSLKSVIIPDSVTKLSSDTFNICYSLTNVVIGNGVGTLPSSAFQDCQTLDTVTIGSGVTNISGSAFSQCPALRNVIIADGANNIFSGEFQNLSALSSIIIPGTVTNIGANAFSDCYSLAAVNIPDSVVSIGNDAFYYCYALTTATLGNSVTSIGSGAFENCYVLAGITIPNTVTNIGAGAFQGCYALSATTLGDGVTSIGSDAFEYCYALTSLKIPDSVTNLQSSAFYYCYALTNVVIGNGVGTIPGGAFSFCPVLSTVTIGSGVTNMSSSSFSGCPALTSIIIADGATNIFNGEFQGMTSLATVTIPGTVTNIGTNAFYGCNALTSAAIPGGVTAIGASAFYNCYSLNNLAIPGSVVSIGNSAFYECAALTNLIIPDSVTNLDSDAFEQCYGLARVHIGAGVTNIGSGAFEYCQSLNNVTISGTVTNIGGDAFYYCPTLTAVYFEGNAPRPTNDSSVFQISTPIIYYLAGATNWGPIFDSRPTVMLTPGALQVTINPAAAVTDGAQWQLDGGVPQASGTTITNLFPIAHTISFSAISNWTTPADVIVTVASNQTAGVQGNYAAITGDLQVNISPAGAVTAGAAWQVDGGSNQNSGAILSVQVGIPHTVSFTNIPGWTTPANQIITVTNGLTNIVDGTYVEQFGSLQVTLSPSAAVTNGALWELDGTNSFASGAIVSNLTVGSHSVAFLPAAGYNTPAGETVTIVANKTTATNATYILATNGTLRVTIEPLGAVLAGAIWQLDDTSNYNSGVAVSNLPAGTYLVSFEPAPGWTPPGNVFVVVSNGYTTAATGVYNSTVATVLALVTNGAGTIQHAFSPQSVQNGQSYTVKAVPDAGNVFENWVGGTNLPYTVLSTDASYTFTMQSNLLVEANFVTNLFLAAQGTYAGLFAPQSGPRQQGNSGSFNFTLTKTGSVTGKLYVGSETAALSGKFASDGAAVITSAIHNGPTFSTTLQLDAENHAVSGAVSNSGFVAALTGYRNIFTARQPTTNAGDYTLVIAGANNPASGPAGASYGTVKVSAAGAITLAGHLADGTSVSQSSFVSEGGLWPLYVNLYGGKGSLWGWNTFSSNAIAASPSLSWINETNSSKTAADRSGFTNQSVSLTGSLYSSSSTLPAGSATATLDGAGLPSTITAGLTIAGQNKISLTDPGVDTNKLTLTVTKSTGVVSGSFANPANTKQIIKVNGVILQDQSTVSGYFLNDGQSGTFTLSLP